jgi:hypothetical protein
MPMDTSRSVTVEKTAERYGGSAVPEGAQAVGVTKKGLWTGPVMSGLAILFLIFDGVTKVIKVPAVLQASAQLEYSVRLIPIIGIILLFCTLLYAIPRTSILGALLLAGYLGGAVASQLRIGNPPFETLFPVCFALLLWGGLYLRENRLRTLIPFRS